MREYRNTARLCRKLAELRLVYSFKAFVLRHNLWFIKALFINVLRINFKQLVVAQR